MNTTDTTTITIDTDMMGSEWTDHDDLKLFALCLADELGVLVNVAESANGGNAQDVSEDAWNRALDLYTAHWHTSDEQIEALREEAATAGDMAMVELCGRALAEDDGARVECHRVINDAQAQGD